MLVAEVPLRQQVTRCLNFNHGRANAPIRSCPMCGVLVNGTIAVGRCTDASHAADRRKRDAFCMHCGIVLRRP